MCIHILPATGSSQAISVFAGMYRRKGPDLCCTQTQGMRRTHALPAPHHKSNLTLPTDAVPSQTKRVIYLRVREHTNARRRSQSGLLQRSRKHKQTKATDLENRCMYMVIYGFIYMCVFRWAKAPLHWFWEGGWKGRARDDHAFCKRTTHGPTTHKATRRKLIATASVNTQHKPL